MEIIENTLSVELDELLVRPLFCFLGTASAEGHPRVSPLWYLWEEGAIWIIADTVGKSYTDRVRRHPETAIAVVDFDVHEGRVEHVGMRGQAMLEPLEEDRAYRLLRRYLGPDEDEWDPRFAGLDPERWSFVRFDPRTAVARDHSYVPSL